jgi:DnaJ-class molecular chaperone
MTYGNEVACPRCNGTGKDFCPKCGYLYQVGGTSVIQRGYWPLNGEPRYSRCPQCEGWGYTYAAPCSSCKGKRTLSSAEARKIPKHVPKQVG